MLIDKDSFRYDRARAASRIRSLQ